MAETALLFRRDNVTMSSSWEGLVFITLRSDGSWSVKAKKRGDGATEHVSRREGIRSPADFVAAVVAAWEDLGLDWDGSELTEHLAPVHGLSPKFAEALARLLGGCPGSGSSCAPAMP